MIARAGRAEAEVGGDAHQLGLDALEVGTKDVADGGLHVSVEEHPDRPLILQGSDRGAPIDEPARTKAAHRPSATEHDLLGERNVSANGIGEEQRQGEAQDALLSGEIDEAAERAAIFHPARARMHLEVGRVVAGELEAHAGSGRGRRLSRVDREIEVLIDGGVSGVEAGGQRRRISCGCALGERRVVATASVGREANVAQPDVGDELARAPQVGDVLEVDVGDVRRVARTGGFERGRADPVEDIVGAPRPGSAHGERRDAVVEGDPIRRRHGVPTDAARRGVDAKRVLAKQEVVPEEIDADARPKCELVEGRGHGADLVLLVEREEVGQALRPVVFLRGLHQGPDRSTEDELAREIDRRDQDSRHPEQPFTATLLRAAAVVVRGRALFGLVGARLATDRRSRAHGGHAPEEDCEHSGSRRVHQDHRDRIPLLHGMLVWPDGWAPPVIGHYIAIVVFAALITLGFRLRSPDVRFRGGILFDALVRRYARIPSATGRERAARISDRLLWTLSSWAVLVDALIVAPFVHHSGDVAWRLITMDAVSLGFTGAVVMLTKKIIGRERPHVTPDGARHPEDTLSFFGGHAAMAFTGAGLVWFQHRHLALYGGAWDLGVGSLALLAAAVTAALRVAADKHYLSDVLVGSSLGLFSGLLVPMIAFG